MLEIFLMPFMWRACIAAMLVAFMASLFGVFVVQRRLSFLGDGLSHSAFGGVALGLLLGIEPLSVAVPATFLVALGIVWLKRKTNLEEDTSIGIFFSVSMALGIVFLALKRNYAANADTYLFGSVLAVSKTDLIATAAVAICVVLVMMKYWKVFAYSSFDEELAKADRVKTAFADYFFTALISLVIVVSIKLVGMVLITSFLVIPAASAKLFSRTFSQMTVYSIVFGMLGSVLGLVVSVVLDLPSGALIILFLAAEFGTIALVQKLRRR